MGKPKTIEKSRQYSIYFKFSLLIYKGDYFMKKARIVLSAVALLAVVGGSLAFKVRQGLGQVFTTTNETTIGGVVYTGGPFFVPASPVRYFAASGGVQTTAVRTTSIAPQPITLTEDGGSRTTTVTNYLVSTVLNTFTSPSN